MRQALLILSMTALVGANGAEAAQDEVLRLGDTVQHVGSDPGLDLFVRVMGQPADDIDKWFISVIVMKNCPACVKLKQDWAKDGCLRALAKPDDNFNPPSDGAGFILGRVNRVYGTMKTDLPNGRYHGVVGYIYK